MITQTRMLIRERIRMIRIAGRGRMRMRVGKLLYRVWKRGRGMVGGPV